MEVDSTIYARLGGHRLMSLPQHQALTRMRSTGTSHRSLVLSSLTFQKLDTISSIVRRFLGGGGGKWVKDTVCSMVLDVLESIVPSRHSVAAIA